MKILHNPRCSKSRQTLALIEQAGVEPEVVLYLETPPTADEMDEILGKLEMEPADLFRRIFTANLGWPDGNSRGRRRSICWSTTRNSSKGQL